jgi:hypothetical protein
MHTMPLHRKCRVSHLWKSSEDPDSLRVLPSALVSATRDDRITHVALNRRVLVEDGFPVGFDATNTSGNHLVEERDDRLLRKVFLLI